jgi:hypothetical protein
MTTGFIANSYFDSDVIFLKKIFFCIFSDFFHFDRVPPMKIEDGARVLVVGVPMLLTARALLKRALVPSACCL